MFHWHSERNPRSISRASDLRSISRTSIETLESWARRLIDEKLSNEYGPDYIDQTVDEENYLFNHDLRKRVHDFTEKNEHSRTVNAFLFKDIINILCRNDLYKSLFKDALQKAYPLGAAELRIMLTRVSDIRNLLSHANTISTHQAEQAICYSHDFVEGLKEYYKEIGMEQTWNVPRIISASDSLGNNLENTDGSDDSKIIVHLNNKFYCGDTYSVFIEIDSSFSPEEYDIEWRLNGECKKINSLEYCVEFQEKDIQEQAVISCHIISKRKWHRFGHYDSSLALWFDVLPSV